MQTITIQIGNTDNKLSQQNWSKYVFEVDKLARNIASKIHFRGGSPTEEAWQNFCWVFEMDKEGATAFICEVKSIRERYMQDSIAITEGITNFI